MSVETWKSLPGYEGRYEVSDRGRIRSVSRFVLHPTGSGVRWLEGRVIKTRNDRRGYPRQVLLAADGTHKSWAVHRAVLLTFRPRPDWQAMHVNHMNGVVTDNRLENLEWCTNAENRLHSYRVLKTPNPMKGRSGALHHNAVAVTGTCIETGEERTYLAVAETARDGFKPGDVSSCACGRQKSHRGWSWAIAAVAPKAA